MFNTLFLRLEGPLQSWGERGHWDVRDTAPEPTKSGVVGLLGCALGLSGDADLRNLSRQLRMGVRVDRPGRAITDYHTIVGGIMSGEGKLRGGTILSYRAYLCDAAFLVALQSPDAQLLARLAAALEAPVWPIYLGRRACPSSRPPFAGLGAHDSLEAALRSQPLAWDGRGSRPTRARAVIEAAPGRGARRRDELWALSRRTYGPRYVREVVLEAEVSEENI